MATAEFPQELMSRAEAGRASFAAQRSEEQRIEAERQRAAEEQRAALWAKVKSEVETIVPDDLLPYLQYGDSTDWHLEHGTPAVFLQIPGASSIRCKLQRRDDTLALQGWSVQRYTRPYWLDGVDNEYAAAEIYDRSEPDIQSQWPSYSLDECIAVAAHEGQVYAQWLALWQHGKVAWEARRAEREARRKEEEDRLEREEVREQHAANARINQAAAEREAIVDLLTRDPLAMALAKAFVAIERNEDGWRAAIESASYAAERAWEVAGRRAKEAKEAQYDADQAERAKRDAEYRADEAEAAAKKAKRGW